jgi:hypothetical protein
VRFTVKLQPLRFHFENNALIKDIKIDPIRIRMRTLLSYRTSELDNDMKVGKFRRKGGKAASPHGNRTVIKEALAKRRRQNTKRSH